MGLESLLQSHFNRADLVVILDFYHAASYVEALARALHPDDEAEAAGQAEAWLSSAQGGGRCDDASGLASVGLAGAEVVGLACGVASSYFTHNVHRMAYPEYVAESWQIGRGWWSRRARGW